MQVICAGSLDTFQIFVWATKTARLLDVLAAHEGPVVALAFSPTQPLLASGSWDKTVRTWDVFRLACLSLFTTSAILVASISILSCQALWSKGCALYSRLMEIELLRYGSLSAPRSACTIA